MIGRREVLGVLAAGAGLLVAGCSLFNGKASYRFRLTVEIETPQGLKSGSSVYEVWASTNSARLLPEEHARDWGVKGEAVAVVLPTGQTLFALLKTGAIHGDLASMSMAAMDPAFRNDIVESAGRIAGGDGIRSPAEVARADWPMLVQFGDMGDPKSVEQVNPQAAGVKRITVELTEDPVTSVIGKRLVWLPSYYDTLLSGERFEKVSARLADHLGAGDFSTELSK